ncbi:hypothetical protein P0Y43_01975 [Pseudomonas entomophila]|uniref:hypothetical protein n=1 Tax=Pseudomonas entomophila TaxID=312306 RepID=UPI0023D81C85|nr:hypothetical protein [Pseudomonas entomophila]MDF0729494.1 hypothetical protein [Pseudomonas entomophila]
MSDLVDFKSQTREITERICAQVAELAAAQPLALPTAQAAIVDSFVEKIAGAYHIPDFQGDTAHAIDLLFIAYNVTPQDHDGIRIQINSIMDKLIDAQQRSERVVSQAATVAQGIYTQLGLCLQKWLMVKQEGDYAAVRSFVSEPLLALARGIGNEASQIGKALQSIADDYDARLRETLKVHAESEVALSALMNGGQVLAVELKEARQRREDLATVIAALREGIASHEELVRRAGLSLHALVALGSQSVSVLLPFSAFQTRENASLIAASRFSNVSGTADARQADERQDERSSAMQAILRLHITLLENVLLYEGLVQAEEDESIRIKTLLADGCRQEKSKELAMRAFNLSLQALARNREIVEVMAFFFRSFSTFILAIVNDSNERIERYGHVKQEGAAGPHYVVALVKSIDEAFIEYAGQWLAVARLAERFAETFNKGWNRLNILSGTYIQGRELNDLLQEFIAHLNQLADARKQRAQSRLVEVRTGLETFRRYLATP